MFYLSELNQIKIQVNYTYNTTARVLLSVVDKIILFYKIRDTIFFVIYYNLKIFNIIYNIILHLVF